MEVMIKLIRNIYKEKNRNFHDSLPSSAIVLIVFGTLGYKRGLLR